MPVEVVDTDSSAVDNHDLEFVNNPFAYDAVVVFVGSVAICRDGLLERTRHGEQGSPVCHRHEIKPLKYIRSQML